MFRDAVHILVVEDDRANRQALERLLQYAGYLTLSAADFAQGMRQLAHNPAILLLDLDLPDGPGEEILKAVRSEGHPARDAHVGIITGSTDGRLERIKHLHPDAVFVKPYLPEQLLGWIRAQTSREKR